MRQIDKANEVLNGTATTNYAGALTTAQETNLVEVNRARADIEALIEGPSGPPGPFTVHLTNISGTFNFEMSAAGNFTVDWGDGSAIQTISKPISFSTYSHNYTSVGNYDVVIGGVATEYSIGSDSSAISFSGSTNKARITGISGDLGAVFPILGNTDNQKPKFFYTFSNCTGLTSIPTGLFFSISGSPGVSMFAGMFNGCNNIASTIPSGFFSTLSGAPAQYMFSNTFFGCSSLTGAIPANLFSGISGAPARGMFGSTFYNCTGLTGAIPSGLFSGISGTPAQDMFSSTFLDCSGLTGSIPPGLFGIISGVPAGNMYTGTFSGCSSLTGSIPPGLFGNISGNYSYVTNLFRATFKNCTGLTGSIPTGMFGTSLTGTPPSYMFEQTFYNCTGLTGSIPPGLFGTPSGTPLTYIFAGTFWNCSGLTGSIPPGLFGNISGTPSSGMFQSTFSDCSGLTGSIPAGLFGTFTGAPANFMFEWTFAGCTGLTGIEDGIWDISGMSNTLNTSAFSNMFNGCTGLISESPSIKAGSPIKIWEHFTSFYNPYTFRNATNLSDYGNIPLNWSWPY